MTDEPQTEQADFKPARSNLVEEIKGQLMNLNDAISKARAAQRFERSSNPAAMQVYTNVYEHLDMLFGLTRELLPPPLVQKMSVWLDAPHPMSGGTGVFMSSVTVYKRAVDDELFRLGIKDTNVRQPSPFPMAFHEKEYSDLDPAASETAEVVQ